MCSSLKKRASASSYLERLEFWREPLQCNRFGLLRFSSQKLHPSPCFTTLPRRPCSLQLLLARLRSSRHRLLRGSLPLPYRAGGALDLSVMVWLMKTGCIMSAWHEGKKASGSKLNLRDRDNSSECRRSNSSSGGKYNSKHATKHTHLRSELSFGSKVIVSPRQHFPQFGLDCKIGTANWLQHKKVLH